MAKRIRMTEFEEAVLKAELPVLVDFYSDSCVACKKLAPVLAGAEDDYEGKVLVYKVNTSFESELAEKYNVFSNPTLILFKGGEEVDRKTGVINPVQLYQWIDTYSV